MSFWQIMNANCFLLILICEQTEMILKKRVEYGAVSFRAY